MIDLQLLKAPGTKIERLQLKSQRIFDEPILNLQVLRREERAFRPDHRLQSCHIALTVSGPAPPRKTERSRVTIMEALL